MGTKTVLSLVIFCFVQGLNADTLLKRSSLPEDSNSPQNERNPVPNNKIEENFKKVEGKIPQDLPENFNLTILKEGNSEILGKLQEDKQTFEEKIKEIVANVTELQEQNSEFLGKLQDDKQEFKDKVNELVANLTKLQEQSSESLNKLQDDKRKFDGQIKEIVTQQDSREKLNFTAPQEENSELLEKLRDDKQKFDDKIKELKDNIQSQQQNRTTKRALTVSLNEDSVISILLGGPSEIVAAFKQKVSETEEDAKELLEKFISSFDGNSDILGNLNNAVNDLVKANLSDSEFASAASSCFEAQEDAISNLVKLTESQIQTKAEAERQNLESTYGNIKAIGKKIEELLNQTAQDTSACLLSLKCVASLSASVVPQIVDISYDVLSETASLQSFKDDVLPDLTSLVASLEQSAQSPASDIAQQTIKCINDKTSGADTTSTAQ